MKKLLQRICSVLLICLMVCSLLPPVTAQGAVSKKITLTGYGKSKTSVFISWSTEYHYSHYVIYRARNDGKYIRLARVTERSYTDTGLKTASAYTYKVVGVKGNVKTTSNTQKLHPMQKVSPDVSRADKDHLRLQWSYPKTEQASVLGFHIYRKATGESSFKRIGTLSRDGFFAEVDDWFYYSYTDTSAKKAGQTYSYRVAAYRKGQLGKSDTASMVLGPYIYLTTKANSVRIQWSSYPGATSYKIRANVYKYGKDGTRTFYRTRNIATVAKGAKRDHTLTGVSTERYMYEVFIEAYQTVKGKKVLLGTFTPANSESAYSLMRNAAGTPDNVLDVMNVRGSSMYKDWTEYVTGEDKTIFANFEKLHLQKGMTKAEKAQYVHSWIHYNTVYDNSYTTSAKYRYVKCIFEERTGQCLQYNGALAQYLDYLGFDARIINGYRRQDIGHFWGEVKLAGRWYCTETGNYGSDGGWNYFVCRYGPWDASNYNFCGTIR